MSNPVAVTTLNALIVGAGFNGVYQLKHLRDEGYKVKLVDSASDYAGVWYWNRYLGARVDSAIPHYEYSDPALWKEWTWSQRFPGSKEIREYFSFVADKWDLRKDSEFNTYISKAIWDSTKSHWVIESKQGKTYHAKYFLLNTGFAAKRFTPSFKGIESFSGTWIHPSYWPKEDPDLRGKKVAVIGTGATSVQISQEVSQVASEFVLFQKTPCLATPLGQVEYSKDQRALSDDAYTQFHKIRCTSFGGFDYTFHPRNTLDDTAEQRKQHYQELWDHGDFKFWLGNYQDLLIDKAANQEAYKFWREKVRARIDDPRNRQLLAPDIQPYYFGCKRVPLENGYYEIFNQSNVTLVDLHATPIVEINDKGIKTTEKDWEFDYIICATGFDSLSGGIMDIDIRGTSDETISEKWKSGVKTYLGMSCSGFPNLFFTYGPQAPTALCNGPTCAETQGDFVIRLLNYMRDNDVKVVNAGNDAEQRWVDDMHRLAQATLFPDTKSWYIGDNIPGKPRECLVYTGGYPQYSKILATCAERGYEGYEQVKDETAGVKSAV